MVAPHGLSGTAIAQYRERGYLCPLDVLSGDSLAATQHAFHSFIQTAGWPLSPARRHKPHLYLKWAADLVRHPALVGPACDLLGPNVMVWRSTFFIKPAHNAYFVPWHQDSIYWKFATNDVLSAWVALTDSSVTNGCVSVVPGSHLAPPQAHTVSFDKHNALLRGQSVEATIDEGSTVPLELRAGQASLHDLRIIHGSRPNPSDQMRAGLVVRYIAAGARRDGPHESATLVAGNDAHGHFEHEARPAYDNDPRALVWHRRSVRRYRRQVLFELLRHPNPRLLVTLLRKTAQRRDWG